MKHKVLLVALTAAVLLAGCGHQKTETLDPPIDNTPVITSEVEDEVEYVKFQDRMSMDWDSEDHMYLGKIAEYHGGTAEDRAYTILVTLNRCIEYDIPIREIVLEELYEYHGLQAYEFEEICISELTKEAFHMIMIERFDNSYGSLEYREG